MGKDKLNTISIIVVSTLVLTLIMILMLVGIKQLENKQIPFLEVEQKTVAAEGDRAPFQATMIGVITALTEEQITLFNMDKRQTIVMDIVESVKVQDENEKDIALTELLRGEVVELTYEPVEDKLVKIMKASEAWKKSQVNHVMINKATSHIKVIDHIYSYTGKTLILDKDRKDIDNIHFVGEYDTLEFIGVDDLIYSIRILEKQGFIKLGELPSLSGVLKIDEDRQIPLKEAIGSIPLQVGKHKIEINIDGYEPFIKEITVASEETVDIAPEKFQEMRYEFKVHVTNGENDYVIIIDAKKYKPDEVIKLTLGTHYIKVNKPGFKSWKQKIYVEEQSSLEVTLVPGEPDPEIVYRPPVVPVKPKPAPKQKVEEQLEKVPELPPKQTEEEKKEINSETQVQEKKEELQGTNQEEVVQESKPQSPEEIPEQIPEEVPKEDTLPPEEEQEKPDEDAEENQDETDSEESSDET